MIYVRGHPRDYDQWRQMGLNGWSYADVLPYFKRSETFEGGGDAYHGSGGPLYVSKARSPSPIYSSFVQAGREAGHGLTDDFNGFQQEGFGPYQLTIRDGERWSAAAAFLHPILDARPNLTAEVHARTSRLLIEKGRVVGVEYIQGKGAETQTAYADAEVLLCAGAVQSPHILQLSGIGDPDRLKAAGVSVTHALKGVGKNLQDHLDMVLSWETSNVKAAHSYNVGVNRLLTAANYMLRRQGPGRQNFLEAGAFLKSRPDLDRPDLQLHCVMAIMQDHGKVSIPKNGFSIHVCQLRPESRGEIGLRTADPFDDPTIRPNYLATEEDRRALLAGVKITRDLAQQASLKAIRGREHAPGDAIQTDDELNAWIRGAAETIYHPVGSCRMGPAGDALAVVDDKLKVVGLPGLRVVDASVMPTLIGGNTNAAVIMIAEKAADLLLGRPSPSPQTAAVFSGEPATV